MTSQTNIGDETNDDIQAITDVTITAFQTLEISNQTEQFIIEALRAAKALTVSLVAELDGRVIGHIAFSPVTHREVRADHEPAHTVLLPKVGDELSHAQTR